MKIKVIEVVVDGKTKFLGSESTSQFTANLVDHPADAHNFLVESPSKLGFSRLGADYDPDAAIMRTLQGLRLPNDAGFAKSGLAVDACYTVEFEIQLVETVRKIGRLPFQPK